MEKPKVKNPGGVHLLGNIIKNAIKLNHTVSGIRKKPSAAKLQEKTLLNLLQKAQFTRFGDEYKFSDIIFSNNPVAAFKRNVPVHDYNKIYERWWRHTLEGEANVCWPGVTKYFALSSGTSESASKRIPITEDIVRSIRKASILQILSLAHYDLPPEHFEKGILMIGGSTHLNNRGTYFEGDLSGINAKKIPFWFQHFYKPGKKIAKERDWANKIDEIVHNADKWDIGIVVGVPAWIQIIMERIIEHYKLNNIHEIWPNLSIYTHGGVSMEPYKKPFEKLLGRPIHYIETYLASEGFIAYQSRKDCKGMQLLLDNGIFYEFIPFNEENFDADGKVQDNPHTITLADVKEGVEYAILLTTNAGTWRYLIGDTVKFTSVEHSEIVITGRTKHFLSLCGEHLSVDNMSKAVRIVSDQLNISVPEFTVTGVRAGTLFGHKWHIGTNDSVDASLFRDMLDKTLCELNDDYEIERRAALKDIIVEVLPLQCFYDFMESKGKSGGQHKFPRVMKTDQLKEFTEFAQSKGYLKPEVNSNARYL